MRILGIIPARYASSRFPGKPLVDIRGKSMIRRVVEAAACCTVLDHIVVATDDDRIAEHVAGFGAAAILTSSGHASGTERCCEAAVKCGEKYDVVINIQGDEPFINPDQIKTVADCFSNPEVSIATLGKRINDFEQIANPNVVKVVIDREWNALFFSRSPIPYYRGMPMSDWLLDGEYFKHIGIYGYRFNTLQEIVKLPPCRIETLESLEQLRWLWNGYDIHVAETDSESLAIDTPADLLKITNTED